MDKKTILGELSRIVNRTTSGDDRTVAKAYIEKVEEDNYRLSEILEFLNRAQEALV